MPDYDYEELRKRIESSDKNADPESAFKTLVDYCASVIPHPDWARVRGLDIAADLGRIQEWVGRELKASSPPASADGYWFGLHNPYCDGGPDDAIADLYVGAAPFSAEDDDWACDMTWRSEDAESAVLRGIYDIAYSNDDGLGNDAEHPLCLAYAAMAVRHLASTLEPETLLAGAKTRHLVVGFDSGDRFTVGVIRKDGFEPASAGHRDVQDAGPPTTGSELGDRYFALRDDVVHRDQWDLGPIFSGRSEVLSSRLTTGRVFRRRGKLTCESTSPASATAVAFSMAEIEVPVLSAALAEAVGETAGDTVQLLPLTVDGHPYVILNSLNIVDCLDESRSTFSKWGASDGSPEKVGEYRDVAELRIDPARASGHDVFRVKGWDIVLIVSAALRHAMEEAGADGASFTPVG